MRLRFSAGQYDIAEGRPQNPSILLLHSELTQSIEVTVAVMTLDEALAGPSNLSPYLEGLTLFGTNATSQSKHIIYLYKYYIYIFIMNEVFLGLLFTNKSDTQTRPRVI